MRELETTIKRAVALADGPTLDEPQLSPAVREAVRAARANDQAQTKIPFRSNAPPEAELRALLRKHAGNVAGVSRELGKDRVQIHRWLKVYGLSVDDFRP